MAFTSFTTFLSCTSSLPYLTHPLLCFRWQVLALRSLQSRYWPACSWGHSYWIELSIFRRLRVVLNLRVDVQGWISQNISSGWNCLLGYIIEYLLIYFPKRVLEVRSAVNSLTGCPATPETITHISHPKNMKIKFSTQIRFEYWHIFGCIVLRNPNKIKSIKLALTMTCNILIHFL